MLFLRILLVIGLLISSTYQAHLRQHDIVKRQTEQPEPNPNPPPRGIIDCIVDFLRSLGITDIVTNLFGEESGIARFLNSRGSQRAYQRPPMFNGFFRRRFTTNQQAGANKPTSVNTESNSIEPSERDYAVLDRLMKSVGSKPALNEIQ